MKRKRFLFLWAALLLSVMSVLAQTTIFEEGFENGATMWNIIKGTGDGNSSRANYWYPGTAVAAAGSHSMYITLYSFTGDTPFSAWNVPNTTTFSKSIKFPVSSQPFQLSFNWRGKGGSSTYLTVSLGNTVLGTYKNQTTWKQETISLPSENYSDKIVTLTFKWQCSDTYDSDPFAVDNIKLTGTMDFSLSERTFDVPTAGSLSNITDISITQAVKLTVTGNIDYRDIIFIRDNMFKLQELDISGANIVAYSNGNDSYLANEIPERSLFNTKLRAITLPNSITGIGNYAFGNCTNLTSINIPLAKSIGYAAFNGCANLTSAVIDSVESIGSSAFSACSKLASIDIPTGISSIPDGCFTNCSALKKMYIPENITSIAGSAFQNCTQLDTVQVNWTTPLSGINTNAFYGVTCASVKLKVPEGTAPAYRTANVWKNFNIIPEESELPCSPPNYSGYSGGIPGTTLVWAICDSTLRISGSGAIPDYTSGDSPWRFCRSSIKYVEISENISRIGNYAFAYCTALSSVTMRTEDIVHEGYWIRDGDHEFYVEGYTEKKGITSIGEYVFSGCTNLASIDIPKTVMTIQTNAFSGSSLAAINVAADNTNYASEDGILYNKTKTTLIQYPAKKVGTSYGIKNNVTNISDYAFNGCTNLVSVVIPDNVTSIGQYAFDGCIGLESITLPLNPIKTYSYFDGLFHTVKRDLNSSNSTYDNYSQTGYKQTRHGYVSCNSCYNNGSGYTHTYYYVPSSLKTVNITGEAAVPANFFQNTNLETVSMPSVQSIGSNAFSGCNLKKIITSVVVSDIAKSTLEELTVTSACTSIPANTLSPCSSLQELAVPFIGTSPTSPRTLSSLFGGSVPVSLKKLSLIRISANIQIADDALRGLAHLEELVLPSNIQDVGEYALYGCSGLRHIYAHRATPCPAFANNTFEGVDKFSCKLHVPKNSKLLYSSAQASGWNEFCGDVICNIVEENPVEITASALPYYGGQILGDLSYNMDDDASIRAGVNWGYDFRYWMEGTAVVSTDNPYIFTVSAPRTLYAVFTPRENENSVSITPQPTEVSIVWDGETGASSYTLVIYTDAARTQVYTTLHFDVNGTPQQAPQLRSVQSRMSHTVNGLQAGADYYYSITSYDAEDYALTIAIGNFETPLTSGIESVERRKIRLYPNPVKESFRIEGLTTPTQVTITDVSGQTVLQQTVKSDESISVGHLPQGIYLVHVNGKTMKIIKSF